MPRTKNTKDLNQTFSAKKEDVAINDSRQLMRRNTSEAWTELEFTGSNETPYTARWYVARAHRKISGAVQDVRWTLENKKSGIQLNKKERDKGRNTSCSGVDLRTILPHHHAGARRLHQVPAKQGKRKNRIFWKS